jgi:hypothetical protein
MHDLRRSAPWLAAAPGGGERLWRLALIRVVGKTPDMATSGRLNRYA